MRQVEGSRRAASSRVLGAVLAAALAGPASAAPHLTGAREEPLLHARMHDRTRAAPAPGAAALSRAAVDTRVHVLLLRVDFPPDDDPSTTGTGEWHDPSYFHLGDPDHWLSSIAASRFASYYQDVSYGRLSVEIDVAPPAPEVYRLPRAMSYYGLESDRSIEDLIHDGVTAATFDPDHPVTDFARYDALLLVHAGVGEESDVARDSRGDIWSLYYASAAGIRSSATGLALTQTLSDGAPIREAIVMPQTSSQDDLVVDPLGVYVHEFGHWLGLPDLYCTAPYCVPDGVGRWSLMGDGMYNRVGDEPFGSAPAHLDAWSKMQLGWVTPVRPGSGDPGGVSLPPVGAEPAVYRLPASSDPAASGQYFLLENRQATGFDAGLPGHGLLVWLIDEGIIGSSDCSSAPYSRFCTNSVNNSSARPGVKLVEADGDGALQKYGCSREGIDCGSGGDPFPGTSGAVAFTPVTVPPSSGYSGPAWVNLREIAEDAATGEIAFTLGFGPRPPREVIADERGNIAWTTSSEPDPGVGFNVYRDGALATPAPLATRRYRDPAARVGATYRVTALDAAGNESGPSEQAVVVTAGPDDARCFIATAAYGSSLDPRVQALRSFRDRRLLTNRFGRALVTLYYRWSPAGAELIRRHEPARRLARWALAPLVTAMERPARFWSGVAGVALASLILLGRRRARAGAGGAE